MMRIDGCSCYRYKELPSFNQWTGQVYRKWEIAQLSDEHYKWLWELFIEAYRERTKNSIDSVETIRRTEIKFLRYHYKRATGSKPLEAARFFVSEL